MTHAMAHRLGDAYSISPVPQPPSWKVWAAVGALIVGLSWLSTSPAPAAEPRPFEPHYDTVIIRDSPGGRVDQFLSAVDLAKLNGAEVRIGGYCASACTLFLSLEGQVCVEADARLGFHAPYWPKLEGVRFYQDDSNKEFFARYPKKIQDWINSKGGLRPPMIWLSGEELFRLVPLCTGDPQTT